MNRAANNVGWGALVRAVPSGVLGTLKNILIEHKEITADDLKRQAYKTWGIILQI